MLKIKEVNYAATGRDADRHAIGLVTVRFTSGRVVDFPDIREDMYEGWAATHYDLRRVPYELALPLLTYVRAGATEDGEMEDEEDDELEDEDEPDYIHENDFLGQETGYRTPGFPGYEPEGE